MREAIRLLLVWCVAFAVALKAVAAVGTVGCGPGHPQDAGSGHADASVSLHHAGAHTAEAASLWLAAAPLPLDHQAHDAVSQSASVRSTIAEPSSDKPKCNACAPCCAAAAPSTVAIDLPQVECVSDIVAFHGSRYADIVIALPDRPPRGVIS